MKVFFRANRGMAIALVLGFLLVAGILGTTLLFVSRSKAADTQRTIARLQRSHIAQSGLIMALAEIKPRSFEEVVASKGRNWTIKPPAAKFGKATGKCVVNVKVQGEDTLVINSTSFWSEGESKEQTLEISCIAIYSESQETLQFGRTRITGEWKVRRFREH